MKKFIIPALIFAVLFTANQLKAESRYISNMVFTMPASDNIKKTGMLLYPDDVVFVYVEGKATYGPLAAFRLGRLNAAGSNDAGYRKEWNKDVYAKENFGALMCRIGVNANDYKPVENDFAQCLSSNFNIGTCPVNPNPVAGTTFIVKQKGELFFEINDSWVADNSGSFKLTVVILSANAQPYQYDRYNKNKDWLCSLIMDANNNGLSYDPVRMEQVVKYNDTQSLAALSDINSYYRFLNEHELVRQSGIRWQQVAVEVTGFMLVGNNMLAELQKPSLIPQVTLAKFTALAFYLVLTSKHGREFIEGTASKGLVRDINEQFYRQLINGEVKVKNAFNFDFACVYAEQYHPDLMAYYGKFNLMDEFLIEGPTAKWFAGLVGCMNPNGAKPDNRKFSIANPRDRLMIGLFKMGYSWSQIDIALGKLRSMEQAGTAYRQIVNQLKKEAFVGVR